MSNLTALKQIIEDAPFSSGVYFWKDDDDKILYIGKALNLKSRLLSYFNDDNIKTEQLLKNARKVDWLITDSEYEALVLENNLIKKHQPKYNILLKDHKTYPYFKITKEDYPKVVVTRELKDDGADYFGPYPNANQMNTYLEFIEKHFKLRRCSPEPLKKKKSPCLYYHMNLCHAPCCMNVDKGEYNEIVENVRKLLRGDVAELVSILSKKMEEAVLNLAYEKAAEYRDAIASLKLSTTSQKVEDNILEKRDYLGVAGYSGLYCFMILHMRNGRLSDRTFFHIESHAPIEQAFSEFVVQYYSSFDSDNSADVLYVEQVFGNLDYNKYFKDELKIKTRISLTMIDRDVNLCRMAFENANLDFVRLNNRNEALVELKEVLGLSKYPKRIEGIDISHLGGYFTVASLVSFFNALPDKKNYRRFKIKTLGDGNIDDFYSVREVVARRFTRLLNDGLELPDLLIIDGGKGQLSSAYEILESLGLGDKVKVIGLAKKFEEIFVVGQSKPIILKQTSPALRLCQAVRDETHRVATGYNNKLRKSTLSLNSLEKVKGIGSAKAKLLLKTYGSVQNIANQTEEEIMKVAKITMEVAFNVLKTLKADYDIIDTTKDDMGEEETNKDKKKK